MVFLLLNLFQILLFKPVIRISFSLEEFIYNYLITLSFYIIPKKGV